MSKIHASKVFILDNRRVTLAAGIKHKIPVVVLGLELPDHPALRDISIDYTMLSLDRAVAFVDQATDETARRGMQDCEAKFAEVLTRLATAFDGSNHPNIPSRSNLFKDHE